MPHLITLLTDFGLRDAFVAVMKGVILRLAPHVTLIDIAHLIAPQNIREGAIVLARGAPESARPNQTDLGQQSHPRLWRAAG